jgi:hypothetical protein
MQLPKLQELFLNAVAKGSLPKELDKLIAISPPISSKERLRIYQNAYRIRLSDSLLEDFQRVLDFCGKREFDLLVNSYISESSPSSYNLADYSRGFIDFLKLKNRELYIFAVQDWLEILAEHAPALPEGVSLTNVELASGLEFRISKSSTTILFEDEIDYYVSFRKQENIFVKSLQKEEFLLLKGLSESKHLEELSILAEDIGFKPERLQSLFFTWMKDEVIYCHR